MNDLIKDRVLGTLYGVALGDAMGMPMEMWTRKQTQSRFGWVSNFLSGQEDHPISKGFQSYETTDDTIVTMLVARLLLDSKGAPDPLELVRRIEAWAKENEKSETVIGPSTRRAFDQIAAGVCVEEAGRSGTTNGASMRIAPVGIWADYRDLPTLVTLVEQLCLPTHNTSAAISAASAVAAAVSHGVRTGLFNGIAETALQAAEAGAMRGNDLCGPSVAARLRLALSLSAQHQEDSTFLQALYDTVGTGLPSCESVPAAIAIACRCQCNWKRCAILCANAGGDTDTMGAIACGIVGAHLGASTFDTTSLKKLEQVNPFDFAALAERLYQAAF